MSKTTAHPTLGVILMYAILSLGTAISAASTTPDERQQRLARDLARRINAFHDGAPKADNVLRVVYFHPADVEPQRDYQERITRIMLDIQAFYRTEMKRNGFGDRTFPLEMKGDELKIHLVKGKEPAAQYPHESGGNVRREVQVALAGRTNLDREYVLIFNGMCRKLGENRYFFHAPYYGDSRSNHRRGLCHVADCELMDTLHLTDMKNRIQYEEHYGKRDQTLAKFNTFYLGGIAHELGHGLGLPHNREKEWERQQFGTSLMGGGLTITGDSMETITTDPAAVNSVTINFGNDTDRLTIGGTTGFDLDKLTVNGGGGNDTIAVARNADMTLTNTSLTVGSETIGLTRVEAADLTGGAGNNVLDASAFALGPVTLEGGGGTIP